MKTKTILKDFIRYASLSVLGMIGVSCYILADTYFVSKGMGTKGLAALNLAIPIYNFIHGTGLMLGMGGATGFSICRSREEGKKTDAIFSGTVYMAILFGIFYLLVGIFLSGELTNVLGADREIYEMTNTYLRWLFMFAPAFIFNDVLLCFIRNDGNPGLAMRAMVIGSLSNILLDYVFIFTLNLGIFGAVFATGLSPVISILVMMPHWLGKRKGFHFIRIRLKRELVKANFALGFPSLIEQLAGAVVMITFNALILKMEGNTGVAAYGVIANLALVITSIYTGIAQGMQPLLGKFYGRNDRKTIGQLMRYGLVTMMILSVGIYTFIFGLAEPVTAAFNSENNLQLQQMAVLGLRLYFTAVVFVGFNTLISIYFTSTEKIIPAHIVSLLRGLFLIVPMAFLLSYLGKMTGIWLAYPVTEGMVACIGMGCCLWHLRDKKVKG